MWCVSTHGSTLQLKWNFNAWRNVEVKHGVRKVAHNATAVMCYSVDGSHVEIPHCL